MKRIFWLIVSSWVMINDLSFALSKENLEKIDWRGIEVTHKLDERLPLFEIQLFFADGALSDIKGKEGMTKLLFEHLRSGTNRLTKQEIDSALDYSAISMNHSTTHEFSVIKISGLIEHLVPATKMFCHLFKDSIYPQKEIDKYVNREISALNNLSSSPSSLINRIFRKVNMGGTVYERPVEGEMNTLKRIRSADLVEHLKYFREKVSKRIYIAGPKQSLIIRSVVLNECGLDLKQGQYVRKSHQTDPKLKYPGGKIYFVPLEGVNQAQIRFGQYLPLNSANLNELVRNTALTNLVADYLGGGFTSILNRELRIKKGLVYSVNSLVALQKEYGRSVVMTSTRLDATIEVISLIQENLNNLIEGKIDPVDLDRTINYLSGSFLFGLETNSSYLSQLIFLDHLGRPYQELFDYPQIIKSFNMSDIKNVSKNIFNPKDHIILVLGPKSLLTQLQKLGKVETLNYHDFL